MTRTGPVSRALPVRAYRSFVALVAATGVGLQVAATLAGRTGTAAAAIVRLLSYFTIQNALAVAVWSAWRAARGDGAYRSPAASRGPGAGISLALAVSSTLTGTVYYALLRATWTPRGAAAVADVLLHAAVPALVAGDWLLLEPHGVLRPRHVAATLALPMFFLAGALVLGAATGRYPYFFVDPVALGTAAFAGNVALFALAFSGLGAVGLLADRLLARRSAVTARNGGKG